MTGKSPFARRTRAVKPRTTAPNGARTKHYAIPDGAIVGLFPRVFLSGEEGGDGIAVRTLPARRLQLSAAIRSASGRRRTGKAVPFSRSGRTAYSAHAAR